MTIFTMLQNSVFSFSSDVPSGSNLETKNPDTHTSSTEAVGY